jgi:hypothetical protein
MPLMALDYQDQGEEISDQSNKVVLDGPIKSIT